MASSSPRSAIGWLRRAASTKRRYEDESWEARVMSARTPSLSDVFHGEFSAAQPARATVNRHRAAGLAPPPGPRLFGWDTDHRFSNSAGPSRWVHDLPPANSATSR